MLHAPQTVMQADAELKQPRALSVSDRRPACTGFRSVLMRLARDPSSMLTHALAGVIGQRWQHRGMHLLPLYGLDAATTRRLLARHFPGAEWLPELRLEEPEDFAEAIEMDDVVTLLADHRTQADEDNLWLAHTVATACIGADHLWQDMDLPSRSMLSELMHGHFTALAARNTQDMKWKKFLYLQLCERADIRVCKAPSCGVCADYKVCFGPED